MGDDPALTPNPDALHWYWPKDPAGIVIGGTTGKRPVIGGAAGRRRQLCNIFLNKSWFETKVLLNFNSYLDTYFYRKIVFFLKLSNFFFDLMTFPLSFKSYNIT